MVVECGIRRQHGRVVSERMKMAMMRRGIASSPAVSPHGHRHVDAHAAHADAIGRCSRQRGGTMM